MKHLTFCLAFASTIRALCLAIISGPAWGLLNASYLAARTAARTASLTTAALKTNHATIAQHERTLKVFGLVVQCNFSLTI